MDFQTVISYKHILSVSVVSLMLLLSPFSSFCYINMFSILYDMPQSFVLSTH